MGSKGLLKAIAIVALVFGILGVIGGIMGLVGSGIMGSLSSLGGGNMTPEAKEAMAFIESIGTYTMITGLIGLVVSIGYLIGGIKLFTVTESGRSRLSLAAYLGVLNAVENAVIQFAFVGPAMEKFYKAMGIPGMGGALGGMMGIVSLICGLIVPLFFIIGLRAGSVKEQFESAS